MCSSRGGGCVPLGGRGSARSLEALVSLQLSSTLLPQTLSVLPLVYDLVGHHGTLVIPRNIPLYLPSVASLCLLTLHVLLQLKCQLIKARAENNMAAACTPILLSYQMRPIFQGSLYSPCSTEDPVCTATCCLWSCLTTLVGTSSPP